MSWLEDAQRGNERLPCWHPLKSGGRGKLFQLGAQLRPCPFGAPPTGTGLSRPKLELCSHAVVLLPFHPWEWYITTNQAKRRANPCEPALSVAIATGYRDFFFLFFFCAYNIDIVLADWAGGLSWRTGLADWAGGLSWRTVLADCPGGLGWPV